jgi:hypothetical protein
MHPVAALLAAARSKINIIRGLSQYRTKITINEILTLFNALGCRLEWL